MVVRVGFFRIFSQRFDVCQMAKDYDVELQCPLPPGDYELTHTVLLPREIPPGTSRVLLSNISQVQCTHYRTNARW